MLLIWTGVVFLELVSHTAGICRETYMVFCDDFADVVYDKWDERWTELVIGSEDDISNQPLTSWHLTDFDDFKHLENLVSITVINKLNDLGTWWRARCIHFGNLRYLRFYKNNIQILRTKFFPQTTLAYLGLSNNNIENIEPEAFYYGIISSIDLSHNNIKELLRNAFFGNINKITLNHNQITYIEPESFEQSLTILRLDYNKLRYIQKEVFDNLENLIELSVKHNQFTSFPDIPPLKKLQFLYVSHNPMRSVGQLSQYKSLEIIDLSHNAIEKDGFVKQFINQQHNISGITLKILMSFNRMQSMDLENLTLKKVMLSFFGNPLDCENLNNITRIAWDRLLRCDRNLYDNQDGTYPMCVASWQPERFRHQDVDRLHEALSVANLQECREYQKLYPGLSVQCLR